MRRPKVFFIGFNKTATCAVHELFLKNEYNSVHHRDNNGNNLALSMQKNIINKNDILTNLEILVIVQPIKSLKAVSIMSNCIMIIQMHISYYNIGH